MRVMTFTWRHALTYRMEDDDDLGPVIAYAPDEAAFDVPFDADYGRPEGPHVLAWTDTRVYFPVVYDGAESMGSAPRHPQPNGQAHIGGW